ncbi:DMT family transporter [Neobacillus pocheonensis]|uniref:EamA family transporter n=1 Tax=Neobacillus pocheonensis TaxID=363869 RepID=UPI003D26D63F
MFLLALMSSFFNAAVTLYAKKIMGEMKNSYSFIVTSFISVSILLACSMPWLFSFHANMISVGLLVVVILLDTISNILFFKSMERIEVSRLAVYSSLTPLFTFLPNIFISGFHTKTLISVFFIVLGIYFLNLKGRDPLAPLFELKKAGNMLGILASVLIGISMVPTQQLLIHQWTNAPTLYLMRAAGISFLIYIIYRPKLWFPKLNVTLGARGVLSIIQWMCLLTALKWADGTLVVALAYTSPLFVLFLARIYFKEKITIPKVAACAITIVGIVWTMMEH